MTVRDAAACLSADDRIICRLAQRSELPRIEFASEWRFQSVDLGRWVEARIELSTAAPSKVAKRRRQRVPTSRLAVCGTTLGPHRQIRSASISAGSSFWPASLRRPKEKW